jgi:23S rRNA C2498 (ribose-2'-O)-methylase RlmM
LFLKSEWTLALSISPVAVHPASIGWLRPLPYPEGYIHIPHEKKYPAESYRKLKEILHLMRINETPSELKGKVSVELGSHPGGWTYVLLEHGSTVYAVDWAKMKEPFVVSHPNFHEIVGDGRSFSSAGPQVTDE